MGRRKFPALTSQAAGARPEVFKVDIGAYSDIELAIVNHVIEQIRLRYPDEITGSRRRAAASCACRCGPRITTRW